MNKKVVSVLKTNLNPVSLYHKIDYKFMLGAFTLSAMASNMTSAFASSSDGGLNKFNVNEHGYSDSDSTSMGNVFSKFKYAIAVIWAVALMYNVYRFIINSAKFSHAGDDERARAAAKSGMVSNIIGIVLLGSVALCVGAAVTFFSK